MNRWARSEPGVRLKTSDDIERIRESGRIIADLFSTLESLGFGGLNAWELDSLIEAHIMKRGARPAFKTLRNYGYASCISLNSEVVHGLPLKTKKIGDGDLVKIDVGVILRGYCADASRTFTVGAVSSSASDLSAAVKEALDRAVALMCPGNFLGDIGGAMEAVARSRRFSVARSLTGHGTGFALHEPPLVPAFGTPGRGMRLVSGLVLALEPIFNQGSGEVVFSHGGTTAVTADGGLSAHWEHTVAVTDAGPDILTG
jgi:methionyl aminopeptidase